MRRISTGVLSCIMLSVLFVCAQALADNSDNKRTIYKFRYNNVPVKQPVVTQSMKSAVEEYNKGNYVGAMVDLKKVVEEEENNLYAKYYLALCYTQLGYKSDAQKLYQDIADDGSSYPLTYYAKRANICIDRPEDDACKPMEKIKAPDLTAKYDNGISELENGAKNEANQKEEDDMTKFIKSGKKIHPAAMDKISRERAERKFQADMYSKQQAEMEAKNQEN